MVACFLICKLAWNSCFLKQLSMITLLSKMDNWQVQRLSTFNYCETSIDEINYIVILMQ